MKKILITEDDALMAEIYRDTFQNQGFSAEVASDGVIAIQRLKENPPDLVVLDLMMPNTDGIEVLTHIRSQEATRTLPVFVMSNAFAGPLGERATKAGATKLFAKNTFGPKHLVEQVQKVLSSLPSPTTATNGDSTKSSANPQNDVASNLPQRMTELRNLLQLLIKGDESTRAGLLLELHRVVHQLVGNPSFAGLGTMAQLARALEALVKDLLTHPKKLNASSLHTTAQAVDFLVLVSEQTTAQPEKVESSTLVLVVDDEPISRETTCTALEKTHLRALSVDDPALAVKLGNENRFDLIFMDVQMPGMDGFEVCKKIHASSANSKTPVIFVTSLNNFDTRARSTLSGGVDFIAKPILLVEVAVKALTHILKRQTKIGD